MSPKVEELQNIGNTIAKRLNHIGVYTEDDLRAIGPVEAHSKIRDAFPSARLPLCYYLFSFEGALRGKRWDSIGEKRKKELKELLG
ncbi:MAG: TfoX/Sxy family DNA transformation protein [Desulfatibacillum sp.]|nr:TfoX/Sxy family DNA transformation protein [Desulfatibacillum sp.]